LHVTYPLSFSFAVLTGATWTEQAGYGRSQGCVSLK
jgi:hypothetical protein